MLEMTEAAQILHGATLHSLALIDGIGRGTSTFHGLALASAIASHLHGKSQAFTLFATHYFELTAASRSYGIQVRIGFSNAIGRPKNGPENASGQARRGPKCVSLGGCSAQSGCLEARGWRVGRFLNVHGSQDWPDPKFDPDVGPGLPTQRTAPPRLQGSRGPHR
jgi:hypothetical protein